MRPLADAVGRRSSRPSRRDWSHLALELRLDDTERTEEVVRAARAAEPVAPGRRLPLGILRFRARASTATAPRPAWSAPPRGCSTTAASPDARGAALDGRRPARPHPGTSLTLSGRFRPSRPYFTIVRAFLRIDGDEFPLRGARLVWYQARCEDAEGIAFQLVTHGSRNLLHVAGWAPGFAPEDLSGAEVTVTDAGPDAALDGRLFGMLLIRFGRVDAHRAIVSVDGDIERARARLAGPLPGGRGHRRRGHRGHGPGVLQPLRHLAGRRGRGGRRDRPGRLVVTSRPRPTCRNCATTQTELAPPQRCSTCGDEYEAGGVDWQSDEHSVAYNCTCPRATRSPARPRSRRDPSGRHPWRRARDHGDRRGPAGVAACTAGQGLGDFLEPLSLLLAHDLTTHRYTRRGVPPAPTAGRSGRPARRRRGRGARRVRARPAGGDRQLLGRVPGPGALAAAHPERVRALVSIDGLGVTGDGGWAEYDAGWPRRCRRRRPPARGTSRPGRARRGLGRGVRRGGPARLVPDVRRPRHGHGAARPAHERRGLRRDRGRRQGHPRGRDAGPAARRLPGPGAVPAPAS